MSAQPGDELDREGASTLRSCWDLRCTRGSKRLDSMGPRQDRFAVERPPAGGLRLVRHRQAAPTLTCVPMAAGGGGLTVVADAVVGSLAPSPVGDGSWDLFSAGGSTVARFSPATASRGVLTPSGSVLVALEKHGLRPGRWRLDLSSAAKASPPVDPLLVVALLAHLLT